MLKPGNYAEQLRSARKRAALSPIEVVARSGVDPSCYHDMEADDDELPTVTSVSEIIRVFAAIEVDPYAFFADHGPLNGVSSFKELAEAIRVHLKQSSISLTAFEELAEWEVGRPLDNPVVFGELSLDGLSSVCALVGVDWRGVLLGEMRSIAMSRH